jgi:hypothetical protein
MQHFFFNFRKDGILVRDCEGQSLEGLDEAIAQATRMAWYVKDAEKPGANADGRQIEICNEVGLTVQIVSVKHVAEEGMLP